jgi:hypothetical protein
VWGCAPRRPLAEIFGRSPNRGQSNVSISATARHSLASHQAAKPQRVLRRSRNGLQREVSSEVNYRWYCRWIASILATRLRWRSSLISVASQAVTISRISALLMVLLPNVRTFASLCSRELRATATE